MKVFDTNMDIMIHISEILLVYLDCSSIIYKLLNPRTIYNSTSSEMNRFL